MPPLWRERIERLPGSTRLFDHICGRFNMGREVDGKSAGIETSDIQLYLSPPHGHFHHGDTAMR
jgi:hypothetical protein